MFRIILANVFGLLCSLVFWYSNFKKSKKQMLKFHLICNILDVMQYLLLDASSAVANASVSFLKNLSFVRLKKSHRTIGVIVFGVVKIILMLITRDSIFVFGFVLYEAAVIYVLLNGKTKYLLVTGLVNSTVWMFYDFSCMAYAASILGIGSILSQIIAFNKNKGKLESRE